MNRERKYGNVKLFSKFFLQSSDLALRARDGESIVVVFVADQWDTRWSRLFLLALAALLVEVGRRGRALGLSEIALARASVLVECRIGLWTVVVGRLVAHALAITLYEDRGGGRAA